MLITMFNILDHFHYSINPLFPFLESNPLGGFLGNYQMYMRLRERERDDDICYHFAYIPSAYCKKKEHHIYIQILYFKASQMISQCIRGDGKKNDDYYL